VGGLVQPPPAARAHRKRTAGRSRSALLRSEGGACPSRVIQAKTPPRNPERFNMVLEPAAKSLAPSSGWTASGQHVHDLAHAARGRPELAEEPHLVRNGRGDAAAQARGGAVSDPDAAAKK